MNNMKYYHDLYSKVDDTLLACIFEIFKKESRNPFELDPAHYSATSGYSWNGRIRFTKSNLKLI